MKPKESNGGKKKDFFKAGGYCKFCMMRFVKKWVCREWSIASQIKDLRGCWEWNGGGLRNEDFEHLHITYFKFHSIPFDLNLSKPNTTLVFYIMYPRIVMLNRHPFTRTSHGNDFVFGKRLCHLMCPHSCYSV